MGKTVKKEQTPTSGAKGGLPQDQSQPSKPKPKVRGRVYINEERCKGCGICIMFCPRKVLEASERFNSKGYHPPEAKRPDDCIGCNLCGLYCPDFAIFGVRIDEKKSKGAKDKEE